MFSSQKAVKAMENNNKSRKMYLVIASRDDLHACIHRYIDFLILLNSNKQHTLLTQIQNRYWLACQALSLSNVSDLCCNVRGSNYLVLLLVVFEFKKKSHSRHSTVIVQFCLIHFHYSITRFFLVWSRNKGKILSW